MVCKRLLLAVYTLFAMTLAASATGPYKTQTNVPVEIVLHAARTHADPFNRVDVDTVFTDPDGVQYRVPAFWDGGTTWRVRYASPRIGVHRFRTVCNDAADHGLNGVLGEVRVTAYKGTNPLYKHGPIRVAPDKRYLEYADGKPFFWFGDTWWMGLAKRLRWPDEFGALTKDRVEKGFTVVQIVAGLYPDMYPFDPRGANEAGFPWGPGWKAPSHPKDTSIPGPDSFKTINPAYFDRADERLRYLVDNGISPCIVGAWGYFMPWMGVDKMERHWRYLIARYGSWPVVWCAAGEANLPWYLAPGFAYDDREQVHSWTAVMSYIRRTDPFHRLLTVHPTAINYYTARHATDDPTLIDFDMLQTPHGEEGAAEVALKAMRESYAASPQMPVIDGEAAYEMLSDSLPTAWTRAMFWICMTNGAAGHTYGANGIWQNNRPGDPHGASPHSGDYGKISSQEAMHLPGSSELGRAKRLFEKYPWQHFRPHPEWADYRQPKGASLDGSHWIWYPEGNPAQDAPVAARFFRASFALQDKEISQARLMLSADDEAVAYLNGHDVGESKDWHSGLQVRDLVSHLHRGANLLAVRAENQPADVRENPAGLIATLEVIFADGSSQVVRTDGSWKASQSGPDGWNRDGFDDRDWAAAMPVGVFGDAPWGRVGDVATAIGPQATGIPGVVRILYMLRPTPITVRNLGSNQRCAVHTFDPVTGKTSDLGVIHADGEGNWDCDPPAGSDHDWVLVMEHISRNVRSGSAVSAELDSHAKSQRTQSRKGAAPGFAIVLGTASSPVPDALRSVTLEDAEMAWHLDWSSGMVKTMWIENRVSGHRFTVSRDEEFGLTLCDASMAARTVRRVTGFQVKGVKVIGRTQAQFDLESPDRSVSVAVHFQLVGGQRRKWAVIKNNAVPRGDIGRVVDEPQPLWLSKATKRLTLGGAEASGQSEAWFLFDIDLDDLVTDGATSGGGQGEPVYIDDELYAALEHPAGTNDGSGGRIRLGHHPGQMIEPGGSLTSFVSVVGVAPAGKAVDSFRSYIQARSLRPKRDLSIFTPFGINNQWGAAAALDDEEVLDVLGLIRDSKAKFDYFSLDTGWVDPDSDLTRFRSGAFPNGPGAIVDRLGKMGMGFGLWFAMEWGTQSAWDYPGAYASGVPTPLPYREGYPLTAGGITFCLGESRYYNLLKAAVLEHVRKNHVRFLKFDGGLDVCNDQTHGHLPGVYSLELKYDRMIDIAASARRIAPDVFVMWYWGLRSPFWALYGSTIFDSGYHLEGSGTSSQPTLFYRDSVTLAQDQAAQYAPNIPPLVKDSLGVWLAETRWGNFMGKTRWREAAVMDLGRGNLLFPNLWGNLYSFDASDFSFMERFHALAQKSAKLLMQPRHLVGDVWQAGPYGYAYGDRCNGLVFLSNPRFDAHAVVLSLDESIGLSGKRGAALGLVSEFPARERLIRSDGSSYRMEDRVVVWLRPFETLMLAVSPSGAAPKLPVRSLDGSEARALGVPLSLKMGLNDPRLDVTFADAAQFEAQGLAKKSQSFETVLPNLEGPQPILAVVIRLRRGDAEWNASKPVATVQAVVKVGDHKLQLVPVPDGRQVGNTQHDGCSWIVYEIRLSPEWSGKKLSLAVHAYLPAGVEAKVEGWVVRRWWTQSHRPQADGYYTDAPS